MLNYYRPTRDVPIYLFKVLKFFLNKGFCRHSFLPVSLTGDTAVQHVMSNRLLLRLLLCNQGFLTWQFQLLASSACFSLGRN